MFRSVASYAKLLFWKLPDARLRPPDTLSQLSCHVRQQALRPQVIASTASSLLHSVGIPTALAGIPVTVRFRYGGTQVSRSDRMVRGSILLLLFIALLGCQPDPDSVRVGSNRWLGYAPFYLADELQWTAPRDRKSTRLNSSH